MIALLSYGLIFIASFFNALMDATENENFNQSRLKKWDIRFWYKRESWKYCKKVFGYRFDAWHISKSLMIICFATAILFYNPAKGIHTIKSDWDFLFQLCLFGLIWNFGFWLFYHKIFGCK